MQLFAVKLHCPVLEPSLAQLLGHAVEHDELGCKLSLIGLSLSGGGSWLSGTIDHSVFLQDVLHLLVGKAAVALDDGVCQMPVVDVGIFV